MEFGGLSPCSQEAVIRPYPEPDKSIPHPQDHYYNMYMRC
jgi:hypothetical protein